MKKITFKNFATLAALAISMGLSAQTNVVKLTAQPKGSEGDNKTTDSSPLTITDGVVETAGNEFDDWSANGTVDIDSVLNTTFSVEFGGISEADMNAGDDFGTIIQAGGIDRDNAGLMGIRGGNNGIDAEAGLYFGLNATEVSEDVFLQITAIGLKNLGDGEVATIISRLDPSQTITVSSSADAVSTDIELNNGSGYVNIASLGVKISGGENLAEMVSVINTGGTGNFRINGIELTFVNKKANNEIVFTSLPTGSKGTSKLTDVSPIAIDATGNVAITGDIAYHDFSTKGSVDITEFLDKDLSISIAGVGVVNTTDGDNYGAMVTAAGIDRAGEGQIGIYGGDNGMNANEGLIFGFDLSDIATTATLQVTAVSVQFLGDGEVGMIVNRANPALRKTFSSIKDETATDVELNDGSGFVHVEDLNITMKGGSNNAELLTVFNTNKGGFRVRGVNVRLSSDTATSTNKPNIDNQVNVYPTQISDALNVRIDPSQSNSSLNVYTLSGSVVKSETLSSKNNQVNTSSLPEGMYICVVKNGNSTYTQKVVKK